MKTKKIMSIFMSAAVTASLMLTSFGSSEEDMFGLNVSAAKILYQNPSAAGQMGYIRVKPYRYSDSMYTSDGALEYKAVDTEPDGKYDCIEIVKGSDTLTEIKIPSSLPKTPAPKEPNRANVEFENPELPDNSEYDTYDAYIDHLYDLEYKKYETKLKANSDSSNCLPVKFIGEKAFYECSTLSKITSDSVANDIPSSIVWIGADAFEGTPWLETQREEALKKSAAQKGMVIKNKILLDGRRCEGIISNGKKSSELSIPSDVLSIADKAFYGNNNLETYGEFDEYGTYHVDIYEYPTDDDGNTLDPIVTKQAAFTIPANVRSIGNEAFFGCSSISNVQFTNGIQVDDGIKFIGNMAFADCSSLEEVNAADVKDLSCLGYQAFHNTPWIESEIEKASAENGIGYREFGSTNILLDGSSASGDVTIYAKATGIPEIKFISAYSFAENATMNTISIPDSITMIGEHAFEDCSGLTELKLLSGANTSIVANLIVSAAAFKNCSCLEQCAVPTGGTEIPDELFSGCSSLTSFKIPTNVKTIGNEAFLDCSSLKSLNVDSLPLLESVGINAFEGTGWLEEKRKNSQDSLVKVNLKKGTLGVLLIDGKASVGSVTIPSDVTEIQAYAFQDNISLTDVTIGNKVAKIGEYAFDGCASLESITIKSNNVTIGANALNDFSGTIYCNKDSTAHVYAKDNDISYEFITTPAVTTTVKTSATKVSTTKTTVKTTAKTTKKTTAKTTKKTTAKTTKKTTVITTAKTAAKTTKKTTAKTTAKTTSKTTAPITAKTTTTAKGKTTTAKTTAAAKGTVTVTDTTTAKGTVTTAQTSTTAKGKATATTPAATTKVNTTTTELTSAETDVTVTTPSTTVTHVTTIKTTATAKGKVTTTSSAATSKSKVTTTDASAESDVTTIGVAATTSSNVTAVGSTTAAKGKVTTAKTSMTSKEKATTATKGKITTDTVKDKVTTTYSATTAKGKATTSNTSATAKGKATAANTTSTAKGTLTTANTASTAKGRTTTVNTTAVTNAKVTTTYSAAPAKDKTTTVNTTAATKGKVTTDRHTTAAADMSTATKPSAAADKVTTAKSTTAKGRVTTTVSTTAKVKVSTTRVTASTTGRVTAASPSETAAVTTTTRPDRVQNIGDSNHDSKLNVRDAAYIARMLASQRANELGAVCDFNGDGKINVRDAAAIAKFLAITSKRN